jgi:hypothetical protein
MNRWLCFTYKYICIDLPVTDFSIDILDDISAQLISKLTTIKLFHPNTSGWNSFSFGY